MDLEKGYQGFFITPEGKLVDMHVHRLQHVALTVLRELQDRYEKTQCGCDHPHCKRCKDDAKTFRVIGLALEDLQLK